MGSEAESMKLIPVMAKNDDRILAVYMNGSGTNPNVKRCSADCGKGNYGR